MPPKATIILNTAISFVNGLLQKNRLQVRGYKSANQFPLLDLDMVRSYCFSVMTITSLKIIRSFGQSFISHLQKCDYKVTSPENLWRRDILQYPASVYLKHVTVYK